MALRPFFDSTIESCRSFAPTWLATHRPDSHSLNRKSITRNIDSPDGAHTKRNRGEFNDLDWKPLFAHNAGSQANPRFGSGKTHGS